MSDSSTETTPIRELSEFPLPECSRALPDTEGEWQALMRRLDVRPSKGLGQHFLFDRNIIDQMLVTSDVSAGDEVVEIGPGLGILTEALLERGASVTAVELDSRLADHLRRTFAEHEGLRVVEADALDFDLAAFLPSDKPFDVVANLPYASGTAILRHLLEEDQRPRRLTVMVQREVAERIASNPPDMSILSVAVQVYAVPRVAFVVPPSVFLPPPSVESAVVVLNVRDNMPLEVPERPQFFRIVNAGFRQKRKQLANTLSAELAMPKSAVIDWLESAAIAPDRRAQTLTLHDWVTLARHAPSGV